jgi:hypothetical protein
LADTLSASGRADQPSPGGARGHFRGRGDARQVLHRTREAWRRRQTRQLGRAAGGVLLSVGLGSVTHRGCSMVLPGETSLWRPRGAPPATRVGYGRSLYSCSLNAGDGCPNARSRLSSPLASDLQRVAVARWTRPGPSPAAIETFSICKIEDTAVAVCPVIGSSSRTTRSVACVHCALGTGLTV